MLLVVELVVQLGEAGAAGAHGEVLKKKEIEFEAKQST